MDFANSVRRINTNMGAIGTDLGTLETDIESLEDDVEALVTASGTLNTSVGTLNTTVGALTSALTVTSTDINHLDTALTASGGATPMFTDGDIDIEDATMWVVQADNKGDTKATSVVFTLYGRVGSSGFCDVAIGTFTLTDQVGATCKNFICTTNPYDTLNVVAINGDAVNPATLDIVIRVFKRNNA